MFRLVRLETAVKYALRCPCCGISEVVPAIESFECDAMVDRFTTTHALHLVADDQRIEIVPEEDFRELHIQGRGSTARN